MVRLRAIGECVIEVGPARIGPDAERAFALLLVLTLMKGRPLGRHRLVDLLWPGTSEERARHNLRQALYKLRQLGTPVTTESNQLRLDPDAITPDVLLHGELEGPPPPELLRADLPFGEFLAGYAPDFSAPFRTWVEEQRGVMHARLRRAALRLLLDERRRGNWGAVETLARKVLQLDPLNEEATLGLAEATALTGSKRAALAILDAFLAELGDRSGDIRLPASVLRRRIAERLEPAAGGAPSDACFVGRTESVAFLNEHFQRARAGDGHTVLVWGEPGIGKTRLLAEFARMAVLDGAQVPRVACQERDTERPLSLFVDAVPLLQALPGALGIAPESVEHLRRLTAHDPAVLEPSAATREAELLFAGVRRAIYDLVDAVASESPLVLVCEDVHWLDAQSWRVLRELAATLAGKPVLLVLSSRLPHATAEPPARNVAGLVAHRLEPLDQGAALALFESLTAGAVAPTSFRDWCLLVGEGNPLHLHSLAHHWRRTGELRAPHSITSLVEERVARLDNRALRVLQACATFGKAGTVARIQAALGYSRHIILDALQSLEQQGMIEARRQYVWCRHSLITAAAESTLKPASRLTLYRCAAEVLEREVRGVDAVTVLWECARLWIAADDAPRAVAVIRDCGGFLEGLGLFSDARQLYEHAASSAELPQVRLDMLKRAQNVALALSDWQRVIEISDQMVDARAAIPEVASQPYDDEQVPRVRALWHQTRESTSQALIQQLASRVADTTIAPSHRFNAALLAMSLADNSCLAREFDDVFEAAHSLRGGPGISADSEAQALLIYNTSRGDLAQALKAADTLLAVAHEHADVAVRCRYLRIVSVPLRRAGRFSDAEKLLRESIDTAAMAHLDTSVVAGVEALLVTLLEQERVDVAEMWYEHSQDALARASDARATTVFKALGARIAMSAGKHSLARERFDISIAEYRNDPTLRRRAGILATATHIRCAEPDLEELRPLTADLHTCFAVTQHWGGQDYTAACLLRAYRALGQSETADRLASEYLQNHRREAYAPPGYLAECL